MALTVFTGGTVIVRADGPGGPVTARAAAFDGGAVVALDEEALARADHDGADLVDLAGGTLIPAPGDGHAHPVLGALEYTGPAVRAATDLAGILSAVSEWKAANPSATWIVGGSYDATLAPDGLFDARWLDEATGDTPAVLRSWDYHTVWVNSAALAAAGITAETPDPPLGRIVRRDDGTPLGILQEAAANNFLASVAPAFSLEQRVTAIDRATREYAELGMTWVQDAWVEPADIEAYRVAAETGRLNARVNLALRADPATWRDQVQEFARIRADVRDLSRRLTGGAESADRCASTTGASRLSAETIKFFLDGVIENRTAALSAPYADAPGERGLPNWSGDELRAATRAFAAAGFQLHLHAIGDAANTTALDAFEALRTDSPEEATVPHVIAHVAMLAPGDAERFAGLDLIANFEPYWAQCDAVMRDLTIPHIGHDREGWQYLIGTVHRSGATISFGSDWPVTTKDWRPALSTAITRRSHLEAAAEPWLPAERIPATSGLAAYTVGIARQALAPDRGTLEVGRTADATWLSRNPLDLPPEEIPEIEVLGTWLAGQRTY